MNRICSSCAIMLAVFISGCTGSSNPKTYPVTGVVTLDGKPVEGASITFVSADPNTKPAAGATDKDGKYTLTTFVGNDGAMPGQYKAIVTKFWTEAGQSPYDKPAEAEVSATPQMTDAEQRAAYEKGYKNAPKGPPKNAPKTPKSGNHLPKQYESIESSGLIYTVGTTGNDFPIELKSK